LANRPIAWRAWLGFRPVTGSFDEHRLMEESMSAVTLQRTALSAKAESKRAEDLEKMPIGKVLTALAVQPDKGLSSAEAAKRLAKYGPNAIAEKEISLARKILRHFTGPIAYMIEAAAIVSAIIGHWDDFVIITGLLLFNAALEFWQDHNASNALAALKKGTGTGSDGPA
jgi:magnesium-transporting ATPase (P-type)